MQLLDLLASGVIKLLVFRNGLRANVREVHETTADRQIRRRGQRSHWLTAVDRVDEHEIGAGLALGFHEEGLEILEITDTPRTVGTNRIQLSHPAPQLVVLHRVDQLDLLRSADQCGVLLAVTNTHMQRVVADRKILRQGQRGGRDELAVQRIRLRAVACPGDELAVILPAIFQGDGRRRNLQDAGIDQHGVLLADRMQDGRRNQTRVAFVENGADGTFNGLIVRCIHAKRREYRHEDVVLDFVVVVTLADIAGANADELGKTNQRTSEALIVFGLLCHTFKCKPKKRPEEDEIPDSSTVFWDFNSIRPSALLPTCAVRTAPRTGRCQRSDVARSLARLED